MRQALHGREPEVIDVVESAYRLHGTGQTVNPDSYFLRFPDRPGDRIIALPASVGGDVAVHGMKWISSFPDNVASGLPRASAVLILNDVATGYPFACLEASIISASRTAASAALAARTIADRRATGKPRRAGFLGTGLIARYVHTYLVAAGFTFDEVLVHDRSEAHAKGFCDYLYRSGVQTRWVCDTAEELIRSSDLVVFATTAGEPYVNDPRWFDHSPLVLHLSLRDLAPEVVGTSYNITDDVEHCMKAGTSLHLTEQLVGDREFVAGTLFDVLVTPAAIPADLPVVFSPFGLGVLDLAVAKHVYDTVSDASQFPDFFAELDRYGSA